MNSNPESDMGEDKKILKQVQDDTRKYRASTMKKGKLIVIDGSDGSGKATQTKALVKRLRKSGKKVRTLDFPQYDQNFFGAFVGECLQGTHGDFLALSPYITSVVYAADRFESKKKMEKWLVQGDIVVLDRYVSANQIHQGGKIAQARKRMQFMMWLDQMEFSVFALPRPDMTIYLEVSPKNVRALLDASGKKQDHVEQNDTYLKNSHKSALYLAKKYKWQSIKCIKRGQMRSIEDIHEEIVDLCVTKRIVAKNMVK